MSKEEWKMGQIFVAFSEYLKLFITPSDLKTTQYTLHTPRIFFLNRRKMFEKVLVIM